MPALASVGEVMASPKIYDGYGDGSGSGYGSGYGDGYG